MPSAYVPPNIASDKPAELGMSRLSSQPDTHVPYKTPPAAHSAPALHADSTAYKTSPPPNARPSSSAVICEGKLSATSTVFGERP